jgi:hypothetical protein
MYAQETELKEQTKQHKPSVWEVCKLQSESGKKSSTRLRDSKKQNKDQDPEQIQYLRPI